jgi:hypothetical protein
LDAQLQREWGNSKWVKEVIGVNLIKIHVN